MLVTPSLQYFENNSSIDANFENVFYFNVVGGDLVVKNRLFIQNIVDNETVYDKEQTTYYLNHRLPANTLKNGNTYKARVMTFNQEGQSSEWSDWFIFTAYSTPVITFTNLGDGNLTSPNYLFTATYSQAEAVKVRSFRFLLYDSNKNLMVESENLTSKNIEYELTDLQNATSYYVEFRATSMSNAIATTGLQLINVEYIKTESGNILEAINNPADATVDLRIKVKDSRFAIKEGEIEYQEDDWIDLYSGTIYSDEALGFTLSSDWTLTFRFKVFFADRDILRINDKSGNYLLISKIGEKIFIRQYNLNNEVVYNSWVNIPDVVVTDIITLYISKNCIGINKSVKIEYLDRFYITDNKGNNIQTNNGNEILISKIGG